MLLVHDAAWGNADAEAVVVLQRMGIQQAQCKDIQPAQLRKPGTCSTGWVPWHLHTPSPLSWLKSRSVCPYIQSLRVSCHGLLISVATVQIPLLPAVCVGV